MTAPADVSTAASSRPGTLPHRHISIRVPWHDNGWNGTICQRPRENASCLTLKRIGENRNDDREEANAGKSWTELAPADLPPCVAERAGFMIPVEQVRIAEHPYAEGGRNASHAHFRPTTQRQPAFSALATPFRWMMRENAPAKLAACGVRYDDECEAAVDRALGWNRLPIWVQHTNNHRALGDAFFGAIRPNESLVFFYAKRTPLADDPRRVIVGVGRVLGVGAATEYEYAGGSARPGQVRSMLWERPVRHSIMPKGTDGFLLPYHQILELAAKDESIDPSRYVAFAPEEGWDEFSYASEHVDHDRAIAALLACERALRASAEIVPGTWGPHLRWISEWLGRLWEMRGPCPGLGAALCAFGVEQGPLVAYAIAEYLRENEDPWPVVDEAMRDPSLLGPELAGQLESDIGEKWRLLSDERRALLKLLSRFALTTDQARRLFNHTPRERAGITISDAELLANPYLLYELDRLSPGPVPFDVVDRGAFPDDAVRAKHPLPAPSAMTGPIDRRRVRAYVVSLLEKTALDEGHTLQPAAHLFQRAAEQPLEPPCVLDEDLRAVVEPFFAPVVRCVEMHGGEPAYQLGRLADAGAVIKRAVQRRSAGKRLAVTAEWSRLLDKALEGAGNADDPDEKPARVEKVAALAELAASRISVLIGPAGTGKTTLLRVLCNVPGIGDQGVLLLAPTGKARVQLGRSTGREAKTIAQFLLQYKRFDIETGAHRILADPTAPKATGYRTVVIDEASMLTEEQLGSVLDALDDVHRLILVGDPRQLPPIGSGRPFVDIIAQLAPPDVEDRFPRVGPGYAELTIRRRQTGEDRDDLLLADWFGGAAKSAGADEVWSRVLAGTLSPTLRFVRWEDGDGLREALLDVLVTELGLSGRDDVRGFDLSLGGSPYGDNVYFWPGRNGQPGAAEKAESWQILSPVNGRGHGVGELNRFLHEAFRSKRIERSRRDARYLDPVGPDRVVYGDKVIATRNRRRADVWPKDGALQYVANGETGVVVGQYKGQKATYKSPWKLEVELSSQPGYAYDFKTSEFGDEGEPALQLAYAITVHRSQGSEFQTTILVMPAACGFLSRELLYTALTRQRRNLVVLHQGDLADLKQYATPAYSETARRLTNLFTPPRLVALTDRPDVLFEEALIHRTRRGEAVRSKSEVIIADLLFSKGLPYQYEKPLSLGDGGTRYPDFTIEDAEMGNVVYWEHLGMLQLPAYRARWERKLAWYRANGILPREEGEGENGTLIVTRDDEQGGIDSAKIEALVSEAFGV